MSERVYKQLVYYVEERTRGDRLERRYSITDGAGVQPVSAAIADTHILKNYGEERYALADRTAYLDLRARGATHLVTFYACDSLELAFHEYEPGNGMPWHRCEVHMPSDISRMLDTYKTFQKITRRVERASANGWYEPATLETVLGKLGYKRAYRVHREPYGGHQLVYLSAGLTELEPRNEPSQYALTSGD